MPKLASYTVSRKGRGPRQKRKKKQSKDLNITSLMDILTVLLLFLIKNVSVEQKKQNIPAGIKFPKTIESQFDADLLKDVEDDYLFTLNIYNYENGKKQVYFSNKDQISERLAFSDFDALLEDKNNNEVKELVKNIKRHQIIIESIQDEKLANAKSAEERDKIRDYVKTFVVVQADKTLENKYLTFLIKNVINAGEIAMGDVLFTTQKTDKLRD